MTLEEKEARVKRLGPPWPRFLLLFRNGRDLNCLRLDERPGSVQAKAQTRKQYEKHYEELVDLILQIADEPNPGSQPVTAESAPTAQLGSEKRRWGMEIYDDQIQNLSRTLVEEHICVRARADLFRGQPGILVWPAKSASTGMFLPLWEINKPGNLDLILNGDFGAVRARRPVDFDPTKPY